MAPEGIPAREFSPLFRAKRGHLAFVFNGLYAALEHDRPDVIHVVSEPWGLLAVQAATWVRRHPGARLVLHGCDTQWHHGGRAERWGRRGLLRYTLPVAAAWVAENSKALGLAADNGLPESSIRARIHTNPRDGSVFRPPTPAERARAREALGVPDDRVAVGLVGRLVPQKGVRQFLGAAELLLAGGFPGVFLIAGQGPLHDEVQHRSSRHLRALGTLAHPAGVAELFWALDVLACPSLSTPAWEEQGSRSLLEGMMCGCVPVGAPTGAIPEMLGGQGVLAAATEPPSLADAIRRARRPASDIARRQQLSAWAHGLYSADAVAEQLVDLWCAVVGRQRRHPSEPAVP